MSYNEETDSPKKMTVREWDVKDRPREKLILHGAGALSPAELLAILIGSGSPKESAVALMQRLMRDCNGSLRRLSRLTVNDLCTYNGIGEAKAITILAACELGRRRAEEPQEERPRFTDAEKIYDYFRPRMEDLTTEEFRVLLLDQGLRLIRDVVISRGGLTSTIVDVRLILREALLAQAPAIALCHNHPSGSNRPSVQDDNITRKVQRAATDMDIRLIDHIVLGDRSYYSYQEQGKL